MAQRRLMIIGSDGFSDLYGGKLARALYQLNPNISLFGIGGKAMEDSGVELLYDISELENLGGFEALRSSHVIRRLIQRTSESMDKLQPEIVVQIGLPVFHLRLIEVAKSKGYPIYYYNTPLNWSDGEVQIAQLVKVVDKVVGVTRHEVEICQQHNLDVEFVGHPLVDIVAASRDNSIADEVTLEPNKPVLALLPGRSEMEIKTMLPILLKAMKQLHKDIMPIQILLAIPPAIRGKCYNTIIAKSEWDNVQITRDTHGVFHVADAAIVTCNSISIEAALAGVCSVAVHKEATATYFIDKMLSRKLHIAMINFVLHETVMPELIQNQFNTKNVVEEVGRFLQDQQFCQEYKSRLARLSDDFGVSGTILQAAKVILNGLQ